jgi:hypothetical protein
MNAEQLSQDHPCVIQTIRRHYLHPPADPDIPYVLNAPNTIDPSVGQAKSILKYLGNQVRKFNLWIYIIQIYSSHGRT